ncbi:MAG: SIS domain-containing protein [Parachlamydiales bacterium]|jgi:D-sedoheptulose 7-phosphate isomerase
MQKALLFSVNEAIRAVQALKTKEALSFLEASARLMAEVFRKGNKLIVAGNGGSLCDAMHFAEEFTAFFRKKRKALPVIVLSEPGYLTAVSNDDGFDEVFSRGVEAFGKEGDVFIALTTSGNSENLMKAVLKARELRLRTVAFLGKTGGKMKGISDLEWIVRGFATSDRIQEAQMAALHILIELIEKLLFSEQEMSLHKKAQKEALAMV